MKGSKIAYRIFAYLLVVCVCVGMLSGCGASSNGGYYDNSFAGMTNTSSDSVAGLGGLFDYSSTKAESAVVTPQWKNDSNDTSDMYVESETENESSTSKEEKLVYSANINIETKEIKEALSHLYAKISEYGGIIQDENSSNLDYVDTENYSYSYMGNATAYIYVRIPQENSEAFLMGLSEQTDLMSIRKIQKTVDNMTDVYYDQDTRLKSLRTQEERLLYFMQNAKTVSEMLEIEKRLTDVQYQIDSVNNSMAEIDNDVKYSKVKLNITEVVKYSERRANPKNFVERVWSYIVDSAESFADTLENWLEFAIYLLPYVVIVVVVLVLTRKKRKIWREKRKERKEKKNIEKATNINNLLGK